MARHQRPLEPGVHRDLDGRLTYAGYLHLDRLLCAQEPLSQPPHHDEMLFIVQHQVSELWFKLMLFELRAGCENIRADALDPCEKILSRVKLILRQLFEQWAVLETLTPSEYAEFRQVLGPASGLQSHQYRAIEFILGNKQAEILDLFSHDPAAYRDLRTQLECPSLYDEFLRHLARHGHPVPKASIERDWTAAYRRNAGLIPVFQKIYAEPRTHWGAYALCEKLVDIDEYFQLWRFRHMKTVERIIGYKPGTGGSSGVAFLKRIIDLSFFPELLEVRNEIGAAR
jgi:tryptophan 2,3-dioxygenase